MNKIIILLTIVGLSLGFRSHAQQDPIYAQYLNNPFAINPAYAGSNNMFNARLQYRTQWAGIDANPTTVNFNSHLAVWQNKVGLGVQVVQDKFGDNTNTEFNTAYSYKIRGKKQSFSFGMQAGFIRYTNDPSSLSIRDPGDPAFNRLAVSKFNLGAGLLLKSDRYIIGLSAPHMLPSSINQYGMTTQLAAQHYYLFGSYAFHLSEAIDFKPSALFRGTKGAPLSVDLNTSFTYNQSYTAGLFTRNLKSYGLLLQLSMDKFRFGYVLELPGSKQSNLQFVSHELTLGISTAVFRFHEAAPSTF